MKYFIKEDYTKLVKLCKKYNKLIHTNKYNRQGILAKQLILILTKMRLSADETLKAIQRNEIIRKDGIKKNTCFHCLKIIGKYKLKKIEVPK